MGYLTPRYDLSLVAASVLIASFASYVALDLAKRVRDANRSVALTWWVGGSIAMGTGIWSMHFVGMLAFSLPITLGYTGLLTFVSWAAAVAVSAVALGLAGRGSLTPARLAGGALAMGAGICAMHYTGMAALDMLPPIEWSAALVAASAAVAVVASTAALLIFFWLRGVSKRRELTYQVAAATAMGLAISGMHYTGMAAARFPVGSVCLSATALSGGTLSLLVGAATLTLLGLTLFASIINGRIQESRLAGSLLIANAELQRTGESLKAQIIERERAEVKLQAQLERLMLLDQITRAIGERQDLQSIYQVAVRSVEENLPVDFACICRHDPADHALTIVRVGARSEALATELALDSSCIEIDQSGLSRCVRGELVYEADIQATPFPFQQRLARGGLRSLVVAPLQSEGQVFGILVAARRRPRAFSSGDCEFLRQLCAHVALAAQQAELYGALQQAYDDLRQTQQSVMDQERLRTLGQMASGIAHDINNALSPAALYAQSLLESDQSLSQQARAYLVVIQRAIEGVAGTVARLREFYRPREPELALVPVDLNTVLTQVAELTRVRWSDMPQQFGFVIELRAELASALPKILGAENEIRDALTNLVVNAIDAMPAGGILTLRSGSGNTDADPAAAVPDRAWVEISDTGVGMTEEARRRCVEPFFTTKGERGTGLGLAMVYGMAQRHSADLTISSEPGKGTTVRLAFPVAPARQDLPPQPQARATQPLRILLVDDDPMLLKSLRDILESDGHRVVTAVGGQAGIDEFLAAHARAEPLAAVITDLGMPNVDGRAVASVVKAAAPTTPVLLLTGWGHGLQGDQMPEYVDRVLSKPPRLAELRAALADIASARLMGSNARR
ncbi:MAG TPA: MHYT domain-containing protein [Steroidobacteraceae bacterium]|nr:MHYT domain-containing protein [Steroidobacteraceae bacterium]